MGTQHQDPPFFGPQGLHGHPTPPNKRVSTPFVPGLENGDVPGSHSANACSLSAGAVAKVGYPTPLCAAAFASTTHVDALLCSKSIEEAIATLEQDHLGRNGYSY